jgi:hypothetical protein
MRRIGMLALRMHGSIVKSLRVRRPSVFETPSALMLEIKPGPFRVAKFFEQFSTQNSPDADEQRIG